jgi:hypothetical protein
MNDIKVHAAAGEILTGEVIRTVERGMKQPLVIVALETSEEAVLPLSELKETETVSQWQRFDALQLPAGNREGTSVTVRVVEAFATSRGGRSILVSERLVEERLYARLVGDLEDDRLPSNVIPPEALAKARHHKDNNHVVRGVIKGDAPDGGLRVEIGDFVAILPRAEFHVKNASSLKRGGTVRVKFLDISEHGITVTRKDVA